MDDDEDDEEAAVTAGHKIIDTSNYTATQGQRAVRELRKLLFPSGSGNPTANMVLDRLSNQETEREMAETAATQETGSETAEIAANQETGREMAETAANQETEREMAEEATDFLDISLIAKDTLLKTVQSEKKNYKNPKTFKEAYFHEYPLQKANWRKAIKKEFHDMIQRGVWRFRKRSEIPSDRRCVKCKWVFKIKRNGVFRARLVACGYTQIPGVDFTDAFSPVIHDTTWRILLIVKLLWGLDACLIDVKSVFLHGYLTNDIYMDYPGGMTGVNNFVNCLELLKCIYGLVQAARQFFRKLKKILEKLGFKASKADPCLLIKINEKGIIFVALYVDDYLCVGSKQVIDDLKLNIQETFTTKIDDDLRDYLSCEIRLTKDFIKEASLKILKKNSGKMYLD